MASVCNIQKLKSAFDFWSNRDPCCRYPGCGEDFGAQRNFNLHLKSAKHNVPAEAANLPPPGGAAAQGDVRQVDDAPPPLPLPALLGGAGAAVHPPAQEGPHQVDVAPLPLPLPAPPVGLPQNVLITDDFLGENDADYPGENMDIGLPIKPTDHLPFLDLDHYLTGDIDLDELEI